MSGLALFLASAGRNSLLINPWSMHCPDHENDDDDDDDDDIAPTPVRYTIWRFPTDTNCTRTLQHIYAVAAHLPAVRAEVMPASHGVRGVHSQTLSATVGTALHRGAGGKHLVV